MIRAFRSTEPAIASTAFIDASAQVIGDVVIGEESSVWMNAVVRGDVNHVRIGCRTNIQDGVIVHVMREPSHPTILGDDITIGHGAIVHGCTIEDLCLIGMGAIVLNGARVGHGSIVAAGTLLPEGCVIPPRSLVMGSPGKVKRQITDDELEFIRQSADNYVRYRLDYM
jgi:carbonic anhydrase/acetyltransferase-like protein (isoleucine patch superfamily)